MKITRKFNLARIRPDLKYESVSIEIEGTDKHKIIKEIDDTWKLYSYEIKKEVVD